MSAVILDGKALAKKIREQLAEEIAELTKDGGPPPGLAVILVGDDPGSQIYVRNKEKAATKAGFYSEVVRMPTESTQEEVLAAVHRLNNDPKINGFLVQLPLPDHLDAEAILKTIDPDKDADGLHVFNMGRLVTGSSHLVAAPCTPRGILTILDEYGIDPHGKEAVIVGRSNIVGKPIALMLMARHATISICHSRTPDLGAVCRRADILVAAIGRANKITGEMIKPGAAVIDVGMNRTDDGLAGDVDFESAKEVAGHITPVPGGVGPMTIAMLLRNTVELYKYARRKKS